MWTKYVHGANHLLWHSRLRARRCAVSAQIRHQRAHRACSQRNDRAAHKAFTEHRISHVQRIDAVSTAVHCNSFESVCALTTMREEAPLLVAKRALDLTGERVEIVKRRLESHVEQVLARTLADIVCNSQQARKTAVAHLQSLRLPAPQPAFSRAPFAKLQPPVFGRQRTGPQAADLASAPGGHAESTSSDKAGPCSHPVHMQHSSRDGDAQEVRRPLAA